MADEKATKKDTVHTHTSAPVAKKEDKQEDPKAIKQPERDAQARKSGIWQKSSPIRVVAPAKPKE